MIAMALVNNPELLIADEPTTALDVTVQAQILDLMRDLQKEFGSAVVIITHDLGVVAELAEQTPAMIGGRCVEVPPRRAAGLLRAQPRHLVLGRSVPPGDQPRRYRAAHPGQGRADPDRRQRLRRRGPRPLLRDRHDEGVRLRPRSHLLRRARALPTAVGGGVLRDVLANEVPSLLRWDRDLYAVPAIVGATMVVLCIRFDMLNAFTSGAAVLTAFVLRLLAMRYHWRAPPRLEPPLLRARGTRKSYRSVTSCGTVGTMSTSTETTAAATAAIAAASEFDRDTAVTLRAPGVYDADLSAGWTIIQAVNGGYLLALLGRALGDHLPHSDPFTISAHYLTPSVPAAPR
ncbi:hypothetical protein BLIC30S_01841 [Bacillus licheniformis]